jgi:hypothetical protein
LEINGIFMQTGIDDATAQVLQDVRRARLEPQAAAPSSKLNQIILLGAPLAVSRVFFGVYCYLFLCVHRDRIAGWLADRGFRRLSVAASLLLLDLSKTRATRYVAGYVANIAPGLSIRITGVPGVSPAGGTNGGLPRAAEKTAVESRRTDSVTVSREGILKLIESRAGDGDGAIDGLALGYRLYGVDFAERALEQVPALAALVAQLNLQEIIARITPDRRKDAAVLKEFAEKTRKVQPVAGASYPGLETRLRHRDPGDRALGFTYDKLVEIVSEYLKKSPLVSALLTLQATSLNLGEMAADIVRHLFVAVKGVEVLSPAEADSLYHYEISVIDETIRALQRQYGEMSSYRIRTEIVRGDLMPVGKSKLAYATIIIDGDGELILRVSEGAIRGVRPRIHPEVLLSLLARHEFLEYLGFMHPESELEKNFERYIYENDLPRSVDSFHSYLLTIEPEQQKLLSFAKEVFEHERLDMRISVDPETQSLLQQISRAIVRLLTAPDKRLIFDRPSDVLVIGGGSGTGAIVGGLLGHYENINSVVSFMDNGGSSGEILLDVARAWDQAGTGMRPFEAAPVSTIVPPGDLMSAIVGGIPERWKRDLMMHRLQDAKRARELLDKSKQYIFETYRDEIRRGALSPEKVNEFTDPLIPIANWIDKQWVETGQLRLNGINHSLQNMIYFGAVFMEGAFQPGWVMPSAYNRAVDRLVHLLGSSTPALASSLQSFNELTFVAELPDSRPGRIARCAW